MDLWVVQPGQQSPVPPRQHRNPVWNKQKRKGVLFRVSIGMLVPAL